MIDFIKEKYRSIRDAKKVKVLNKYCKVYDISPNPRILLEDIKTVALLRWDNKLGDSIMSTLFISNIQKHRPDIDITVITQRFCAEWFKKSTNVKVIECGRRSLNTAKFFKQYKGKFDAVIDLSSNFDFKDLVALHELGAMYNIGYKKNNYNIFNVLIKEDAIHFSERNLEAARLFTNKKLSLDFPLIPFQKNNIISKKSGKYYVAINLFGSSKYRQFNKRESINLLKSWIEEFPNDSIYLIPVPGKIKTLQDIQLNLNSDKVLLGSTEPSLEYTLQLLDQTDLCLTPDTSVVHMASALNTPVIAIYSSNSVNFNEWKPLSSRFEVIFNAARKNKASRTYVYDFSWEELARKRKKICNEYS